MVDISIAIFIQKQNLFTNLSEWCSLKYTKYLSFLVVKNAPALTNSQKSIQQFAIFEKNPKPNRWTQIYLMLPQNLFFVYLKLKNLLWYHLWGFVKNGFSSKVTTESGTNSYK